MMKWVSSPNINQPQSHSHCTCLLCQFSARDHTSTLKKTSKHRKAPCEKYMSRTLNRSTGGRLARKLDSDRDKTGDNCSIMSFNVSKSLKSRFNSLPNIFRKKHNRYVISGGFVRLLLP